MHFIGLALLHDRSGMQDRELTMFQAVECRPYSS